MKTTHILIAGILFLSASCGETEIKDTELSESTTEQTSTEVDEIEVETDATKAPEEIVEQIADIPGASDVLLGIWTGDMDGNKLTLVIDKVEGDKISGYNTIADTRRPITGTIEPAAWDQPCSKAFKVTLNEPGDATWDGVFGIKFVGYQQSEDGEEGMECEGPYSGAEAMGDWKANNGNLANKFILEKRR